MSLLLLMTILLLLLLLDGTTAARCHVMEHESFESDETAAIMNKSFVNIKVDREERPDVDRVYVSILLLSDNGVCSLAATCIYSRFITIEVEYLFE